MSRIHDPLLTIDQVGDLLGTGPRFPRRLIAERRIEYVKVGRYVRIPESEVIKYVNERRVKPRPHPQDRALRPGRVA
jgi:excisionase family DNA binding protein